MRKFVQSKLVLVIKGSRSYITRLYYNLIYILSPDLAHFFIYEITIKFFDQTSIFYPFFTFNLPLLCGATGISTTLVYMKTIVKTIRPSRLARKDQLLFSGFLK